MAWGDGRKRRQRRRKQRRSARRQRQSARQQRRQTRVAGRYDPEVVLARTQGRQALAGQALEMGSKLASELTGMDLATDAYTGGGGMPANNYDEIYVDEPDPGINPLMIAGGVGVLALVAVLVLKK